MYQVETHLNGWTSTGPRHTTYGDAHNYLLLLRALGDTSRLRVTDVQCTATGTPDNGDQEYP